MHLHVVHRPIHSLTHYWWNGECHFSADDHELHPAYAAETGLIMELYAQ